VSLHLRVLGVVTLAVVGPRLLTGFHVLVSPCSTLKTLDLAWNGIRRQGAIRMAKALNINTSLQKLDVAWNGFNSDGSEHMGMMLSTNTSLRMLDLSHNTVDAKSAIVIANNLKKNSTLTNLQMNGNPLAYDGGRALMRCMDTTGDVRIIGLEGALGAVGASARARGVSVRRCSSSPQAQRVQTVTLRWRRRCHSTLQTRRVYTPWTWRNHSIELWAKSCFDLLRTFQGALLRGSVVACSLTVLLQLILGGGVVGNAVRRRCGGTRIQGQAPRPSS